LTPPSDEYTVELITNTCNSPRIVEKIRNPFYSCLTEQGEVVWRKKNQGQQISLHCPFNVRGRGRHCVRLGLSITKYYICTVHVRKWHFSSREQRWDDEIG
jgi:hypothetical protein